ncbi:MAG TPA: hypothetical protein ENK18_17740 [Deltaproteobacteria bacterium]|nr:hypothetical protein [Deltaproteobacteria bacterium]
MLRGTSYLPGISCSQAPPPGPIPHRSHPGDDRRLVRLGCLYLVAIEGALDTDGDFDDGAGIRAMEQLFATPP